MRFGVLFFSSKLMAMRFGSLCAPLGEETKEAYEIKHVPVGRELCHRNTCPGWRGVSLRLLASNLTLWGNCHCLGKRLAGKLCGKTQHVREGWRMWVMHPYLLPSPPSLPQESSPRWETHPSFLRLVFHVGVRRGLLDGPFGNTSASFPLRAPWCSPPPATVSMQGAGNQTPQRP